MRKFSIKAIVLLSLLVAVPAFAETVLTPAAGAVPSSTSLYDYRTTYELQEEFATGFTTSTTIGTHGWLTTGGTTTHLAPEVGEPGIIRRDTSSTINTTTSLQLYSATRQFLGSENYSWLWRVRLNTNDANTTIQIGVFTAATITPVHGVYLQKLDADSNWHCVTRNSSTSVPVDSGVPSTTEWVKLEATKTAAGVQFLIDGVNVCGLMTTNVPTGSMLPVAMIVNSSAESKTFDAGYYQHRIKVSR